MSALTSTLQVFLGLFAISSSVYHHAQTMTDPLETVSFMLHGNG